MSITLGITSPVSGFESSMEADRGRALGPEVRLINEQVGVKTLTVDGYADAIERVGEAARWLVARGASAVMIGGTSLTFFRGHEFHNELLASVAKATGVPVSSTSQSLVEALRAMHAHRLAVATAYTEAVSELLRQFLTEIGFEFLSLHSMGFEQTGIAGTVSTQGIVDFSRKASRRRSPRTACSSPAPACGRWTRLCRWRSCAECRSSAAIKRRFGAWRNWPGFSRGRASAG